MGAGYGLYQNDDAADLKNTIALLSNLPAGGDRILDILLSHRGGLVGLDQAGGPTFWLVVADQFERRGIRCDRAFQMAQSAIDSGADLRDMTDRGMSPPALRKREKVLAGLAARLRTPRGERPRRIGKKPPPFLVEVGEVFAFPVMKGQAANPWAGDSHPLRALFEPDGWGAMIILALGRGFDWFPWCAYASLSVPAAQQATLDDVVRARLCIDDSAQVAVPRRLHLQRLGATSIWRLRLDPEKVAARVPVKPDGHDPEFAVTAGWSFYPRGCARFEGGIPVADLVVG